MGLGVCRGNLVVVCTCIFVSGCCFVCVIYICDNGIIIVLLIILEYNYSVPVICWIYNV